MPAPTLPIDIYGHILQNLGKEFLLNLLFVSRAFNRETERQLYHTILYTSHQWSERRCTALFSQLIRSDRVGPYIHALHLSIPMEDLPSERRLSLSSLLQASYRKMPNLKILTLRLSGDADIIPQPEVPFHLHKLHLWSLRRGSDADPPEEQTAVHAFLESRKLDGLIEFVTSQENILPLSPAALPNLLILTCAVQLLAIFLPGRHVAHLRSIAGGYLHERDDASSLLASINIKSLFTDGPELFKIFEQDFIALESLELTMVSEGFLRVAPTAFDILKSLFA